MSPCCYRYRMTQVAVHWQVKAADLRHYDVLFIGTDNGRVLKAVNKGHSDIETVVIEDLEVFTDQSPVVSLKLIIDETQNMEKLIVVSRNEVKALPLHRCHAKTTCRCVGVPTSSVNVRLQVQVVRRCNLCPILNMDNCVALHKTV